MSLSLSAAMSNDPLKSTPAAELDRDNRLNRRPRRETPEFTIAKLDVHPGDTVIFRMKCPLVASFNQSEMIW